MITSWKDLDQQYGRRFRINKTGPYVCCISTPDNQGRVTLIDLIVGDDLTHAQADRVLRAATRAALAELNQIAEEDS